LTDGKKESAMNYEYVYPEDDARIPEGWSIAVFDDGKAMPLTPRTSVRELGGHAIALPSYEDAVESIPSILKEMSKDG
jgi:hypothetical protein